MWTVMLSFTQKPREPVCLLTDAFDNVTLPLSHRDRSVRANFSGQNHLVHRASFVYFHFRSLDLWPLAISDRCRYRLQSLKLFQTSGVK